MYLSVGEFIDFVHVFILAKKIHFFPNQNEKFCLVIVVANLLPNNPSSAKDRGEMF